MTAQLFRVVLIRARTRAARTQTAEYKIVLAVDEADAKHKALMSVADELDKFLFAMADAVGGDVANARTAQYTRADVDALASVNTVITKAEKDAARAAIGQ